MSNLGLGANFDVGSQIGPVDLADGANTGHRINMQNYEGICFVGYITTGTAAEAPTFAIWALKAKVFAAARAGIETIVLPRRNEKDLIDIPDDVRSRLEIQLVDTIDEALQHTLSPSATAAPA